jgi:hypothetical protein
VASAHGSVVPVKGRVLSDVSSYVQKLVVSCGAPTMSVTQFIKLSLFKNKENKNKQNKNILFLTPHGAAAPSGSGSLLILEAYR